MQLVHQLSPAAGESHATVHTYRTGQSNRSVIGSLDSVGKKPVPAIFKNYMPLMNVHIRYLDSKSYTVRWICALETKHMIATSFLDDDYEGPEYELLHTCRQGLVAVVEVHVDVQ